MSEPISLPVAAEDVGDAADCLCDAIKTLKRLEKQLPPTYRNLATGLRMSIEQNKSDLIGLKAAIHTKAHKAIQPNFIFNQPPAEAVSA